MKTCDEMLESVLRRAKKDIAKRNNIRKMALTLSATGLCLVLVLSLALAPWGNEQSVLPTGGHIAAPPTTTANEPPQTHTGKQPAEPKLYLLSSNGNRLFQEPMLEDMTMPASSWIRIRRFGDLSAAEREQAMDEERAYLDAFNESQYATLGQFAGGASIYYGVNNIVSVLNEGVFSLEFADHTLISSIKATTTEVGGVSQTKIIYHETATYGEGEDQITFPAGTLLYKWYWDISAATRFALLDDPNLPLSTIHDTITITIDYANGTQETILIDITVNNEGQVFMTLRGNNL